MEMDGTVVGGGMLLEPLRWLSLFHQRLEPTEKCDGWLFDKVYGTNLPQTQMRKRCEVYIGALQTFIDAFPTLSNSPVFIVRCPGRVNLRGMHIDSHGGACNAIAIARETVLVVYPGPLDPISAPHCFSLYNSNPLYEALHFDLSTTTQVPQGWGRYIVGAGLAMNEYYNGNKQMKGICGAVNSDVPTGSGVSSSHSLVVGFMEAVSLANRDNLACIPPISLLELARAAEGKAGAVTGLGDQGAMKFARTGHVLSTCFYQNDHSVIQPAYAKWPQPFVLVIVDSLKRRDLSGKEAVNYAVPRFAYSIALGLLKELMRNNKYPDSFIDSIDRLSRISSNNFGPFGGTKAIYKLLKSIPESITVIDLITTYPSLSDVVKEAERTYLSKLSPDKQPKTLSLRGPLLFGISECARASRFFSLLNEAAKLDEEGKDNERLDIIKEAGHLMTIGHLGDSPSYAARAPISDDYLDDLIARLERDESDREAWLEHQPGAFNGSTSELDEIQRILVDNGALGASLTGAGMGGVVVGLVHPRDIDRVRNAVRDGYFAQHHHFEDGAEADELIECCFMITTAIAGVGLFPTTFNM